MTAAALLLGLVTAERIAELTLSRRNTAALLAKGAVEFAPRHYPAIVVMHALWLASLWIFGATRMIDPAWLAVFLSLQVLRVWTLMTLGPRWTTRIIVLPGSALVSNGPYRIVSHPNYLVVVGEIALPGPPQLTDLEHRVGKTRTRLADEESAVAQPLDRCDARTTADATTPS